MATRERPAQTAAVLLVIAALLTGCGIGGVDNVDPRESAEPTEEETIGVAGILTLEGGGGLRGQGAGCWGSGGYSDLRPGAQVTVYNASGGAIALGELVQAVTSGRDCQFEFGIYDVPRQAESPLYSIEVTDRGKLQFTEEESQTLTFSLGSRVSIRMRSMVTPRD